LAICFLSAAFETTNPVKYPKPLDPNLGKPGYVSEVSDFLTGSMKIPCNVFIPKSKRTELGKYAWEED